MHVFWVVLAVGCHACMHACVLTVVSSTTFFFILARPDVDDKQDAARAWIYLSIYVSLVHPVTSWSVHRKAKQHTWSIEADKNVRHHLDQDQRQVYPGLLHLTFRLASALTLSGEGSETVCNGSIDSLYQQRLAGLFHGPASTIKHAASTARGSRQNRHDIDQDPHQVSNASPFSTAPFGCPCQESIVVYYCARTCTAYKLILNHRNALPSASQTLKNTR